MTQQEHGHSRARAPRASFARQAAVAAAVAAGLALGACSRTEGDARLTTVPGGDVQRGKRLLTHYQCGSCHAIPQVPSAAGRIGPPLEAFGKRVYIAGEVPNGPGNLQRWLQDPQALVPDTRMPDMGVTAADARDMAAYLLALE
jgi:cytochrome c2